MSNLSKTTNPAATFKDMISNNAPSFPLKTSNIFLELYSASPPIISLKLYFEFIISTGLISNVLIILFLWGSMLIHNIN